MYPPCKGLYAVSCSGVITKNNMYVDSENPVTFLISNNCSCEDIINNPVAESGTIPAVAVVGQEAIKVENSKSIYIKSVIKGATGAFASGVTLVKDVNGDYCKYVEVNKTCIDVNAIRGGEANRVITSGLQDKILVSGV
jgi:hypothetical protein